MIEKLLGVFASPGFSPQANAFRDGALDQFFFGSRFEDFVEGRLGCLLVDFLQPQVPLQPAAADGPLAQAQRCIALRELGVVQIAVAPQALDDFINYRFCRPARGG